MPPPPSSSPMPPPNLLPTLHPGRTFATTKEMKVLMQQGVAETALYLAYMLRGELDEYQIKVGG